MNNIYFARVTPGGSASILVELLGRDRFQRFAAPCPIAFVGDDSLSWPGHYMTSRYVHEINQCLGSSFKNIQWHQQLDFVKLFAVKWHPQIVYLATYQDEVFHSTVDRLECLSIAVNYSVQDFDFVRRKWARWMTGVIMTDARYIDTKKRFISACDIEQFLIQRGSAEFGYELPIEMSTRAKVEIDIRELFDGLSMKKILDNLGCEITDDDWYFYNKYLECSG